MNNPSPARKLLQVLEHPQEDVLRQILRFRIAVGEAIANRVHTPGVHPHQVFPSGFLAAQAALYELDIRIQADRSSGLAGTVATQLHFAAGIATVAMLLLISCFH